MKKVYLGGTWNNSAWRDDLIKLIKIDYFNPIVESWSDSSKEEELRQRKLCDYVLYVITPRMTGVYSIAEAVDDSNKRPDKTIFCFLHNDNGFFSGDQIRSLVSVGRMIERNGGKWLHDIPEVADYLNTR